MRVSTIEGHRLWAPIYDSGPNPILALERRAMLELLRPLQPATVIDVGCGTGQWLSYFQQARSEVFGCDACEEMLREATKIRSLRGRVILAEAENIPFCDSTVDLVLCSLALGYFLDIHSVFREFARASKRGGLIAVSDLHPKASASGWTRSFRLGAQLYHLEHYSRSIEEISGAASDAALSIKFYQEVYFSTPELPIFQQNGKGDLFRTVARTPALFVGLWEKPC